MISGIRNAAEGMDVCVVQQEIIANNLANAATTGFKSGRIFLRLLEDSNTQQLQEQEIYDYQQGALKGTGNVLDLALAGSGFFVVQSAEGVRYTRNGAFNLDGEGFLTSADGAYVLGEKGPIQVDGEVTVSEKGEVYSRGRLIDQLNIVDFARPYRLHNLGRGQFVISAEDSGAVRHGEAALKQGYLEQSNVDAIQEMVSMITVFRIFEANAKALKAHDETLGRAVNEVGTLK